jgi:hypothetical protein
MRCTNFHISFHIVVIYVSQAYYIMLYMLGFEYVELNMWNIWCRKYQSNKGDKYKRNILFIFIRNRLYKRNLPGIVNSDFHRCYVYPKNNLL